MDSAAMAAVMYPTEGGAPPPASGAPVAAGGVKDVQQQAAPVGQTPAEVLFGDGGAPMEDYGSVLGGLFDASETEARASGDQSQTAELSEARAGLNEAMIGFDLAEPVAREVVAGFQERIHFPKSADAIEAERGATMAALTKKWGGDTDKMIAGAQRVLQEAAKRVPRLMEQLDATGYGNDQNLIEKMANIAKRRGWC